MLRRAVASRFGIVRWVLGALATMAFAPSLSSAQVAFNVGAGGNYTAIQAAVNACPAAGCVINLTDTTYTVFREVWIEGKNNLTLQASPSLQVAGIRPRIHIAPTVNEFTVAGTAANPTDVTRPAGWKKWPINNTTAEGGAKNTTNQYSTSGFQNNGYIVVYKSTNISIEGIMVDGLKAKTFVNTGIWSGMYDVFFGNVGINLFESKNVTIRNTEVKNCFAAMYLQNRNVGGAFAAPNPDDLDVNAIIPYSQFGKMGNHLIEKNYFHDNWYVFYDEMEWDIGSTIRYNLCDQNYNQQFAQNQDSSAESNNMTGGFMYVKDVTIVPHKIYNNTINGSSIVIGHGYFKPGVQHYFYNNLLTGWNRAGKNAAMIGNDRQMLKWYKNFLYNNTFEVGEVDSFYQTQSTANGQISDTAACRAGGQAGQTTCWLPLDTPVKYYTGIKNQWLWNGWEVYQGASFEALVAGTPYRVYNNQNIDTLGVGGFISKMAGLGTATANNAITQANFWAKKIRYKSTVGTAAGFLEPVWTDSIVEKTIHDKGWTSAGNTDADLSMPDRGAVPAAKGALIASLTLKDQSIVTLDPTAKTVSFQYCIDAAAGTWTNLSFDMTSYYRNIARSTSTTATPAPDWPVAATLTTTSKPAPNACGTFTATLPSAPVDSFARFDLVVKGDLNGKSTKSNVGVWIWRKTAYALDVWFTDAAGNKVTSARVGDAVKMHVIGKRNDNGTTIPLDVLTASPDKNMFLSTGVQVESGDTIATNLPAAEKAFDVYFTQTGPVTVAMSGKNGVLPVPGSASIVIRPGLPDTVEWQIPLSYKFIDRTLTMDSTAAVIPQAPTAVSLQVKDKWGNNVDTTGTISIQGKLIDPFVTDLSFAQAASGPFTGGPTGPWILTFDATGAVDAFILAKGAQGQKFWGFANVVGKTAVDSALMKLGTQMERLYFNPVVAIDTFVTVRQKVHIILSEDGSTAKSTSAWSTANVNLRSKFGTKFYASATSTTPLDSVVLAAGEVDLWVTSDVPLTRDTLVAYNLMLGQGLPTTYAPVSFRMPPVPPSPVPDSSAFLDVNCDGKADVARLWLKATTAAVAALDTTSVKPELIVIKYADGTLDSIGPTGWRAVGGNFSILDLTLAKAPAISNPVGTLSMTVRLLRPPAADTIIVVGTTIRVSDHVAPRPTAGAIIENFTPGTVADTVRVAFSEPVVYTGTAWPFQTREVPAGTLVNTAAIAVAPMSAAASTTLTFVISGNAAGTIHAGQSIAIDSTAMLVDASGNHGKAGECLGDTAVLALVPQPVPMVGSWMKDGNGDGRADRLTIVFRRALRAVDVPDKFDVVWGTSKVTDLSLATTTDSITWTIAFADPFPKGVTTGNFAGGVGQLTLTDGTGAIARVQNINIVDSVSPIPVKAELHYGAIGGRDTLIVTYSEAMTLGAGASWMLDQRLADAPISVDAGIAVGTDGLKYAFVVDASAANYPRPGDSIRLPAGVASKLADARGILPSSPSSPYVEVTALPIPMVRSALHDANGDGAADQVTVQFLRKLRISDIPDSLVLTWGAQTRTVKFTAAATTDSSVWTISVTPFAKGVTAGTNADGSGTAVSYTGSGLAKQNVSVPMVDSVAPIPVRAELTYGQNGASDVLSVTYSEPLTKRVGSSWMLDKQAGDAAVSVLSGAVSADNNLIWNFQIDATATVYPHPDDSIRLPSGIASNFADARGILPTSPTPYVVVQGPPIPMVSAFLRDANGDGSADQATVKFLKALRASDRPDSLTLTWGGEVRTVLFSAATKVGSDSSVWTISVAPFIKGVTVGGGANGSGLVTLRKDARSEPTQLDDSVAPIPVAAELRYGAVGGRDTLVVRYSESLVARAGSSWMLNQKAGDASVGAVSGSVSVTDNLTWILLVDPSASGFAHPGDSIRLPSGAASSLADVRGVLPTSPTSPYVMVVGGDRPPVAAWYTDENGDGRVDHVSLEFAEALTTNPTYVLHWGTESRDADTSNYGGSAVGKTRLKVTLSTPFAYGVTSSDAANSYGIQTSSMQGASSSVSSFPIQDSVPPVILTAHVGYTNYSAAGSLDTLFLKLSEPVTVQGATVTLGRGSDGNAYPIGDGRTVANLVQVSGDSLIFFCDTSCVDAIAAAGMPDNGDSIRLTMPRSGVSIQDLHGNAPGADAKWTIVKAGDRPYTYNVNIFPHGVLVEGDGFVPNPQIKSKTPISVWIFKDGTWLEMKNGQLTGESYPAGKDGAIETNGVGLKVDINGPFEATLLLYDRIGTFISSSDVKIDSATAKALGNSAGKFSVLFLVNGRNGSPDKVLASGVYLIRYLTFRDELQANGTRQHKVLENRIYKIGRKGNEK